MDILSHVVITFLISAILVGWIHPKIVQIAILKNIVDQPDARKLQRQPVPVLGGVAVFFGIVAGIGSMYDIVNTEVLMIVVLAMMAMLYTGTMDDILSLSPKLRFLIEIVVMLLLITYGGYSVNNFHGLWGIGRIPEWAAIILTLFASIGIINAINLIDGVNGLSSGFCILACSLFGVLFLLSGNISMTILATASAGALIPFFFHNVFGKTSRMFIGDGGTLVMGIVMSVFVISTLRTQSFPARYVHENIGLIPFTLAVLSVPVFDTLRVMFTRILKGKSPFKPDKTHLHHIFIQLGCSHIMTTLAILSLSLLVVLCWGGGCVARRFHRNATLRGAHIEPAGNPRTLHPAKKQHHTSDPVLQAAPTRRVRPAHQPDPLVHQHTKPRRQDLIRVILTLNRLTIK